MKKVTLIAALAMAAVAVQASTVSWGTTDDIMASDYSYGTAFFINADNVDLGNLVVQYDNQGVFSGIKGLDASKVLDSVDIEDGAVSMGSTVVDNSGTFALIFVDTGDGKFGVTDAKSLTVVAGNSSDVKSLFWGDGSEYTLTKNVETVPEPTTIALLALGLAAVGLRRKTA